MMPQDVNREIRAVDKEAITANLADCVRRTELSLTPRERSTRIRPYFLSNSSQT
jgi:hypothetical protein